MNLKEIIALLKTDFPRRAIDLAESLELLSETISDTMNTVNEKINEAFLNRDFESRERYNHVVVEIYEYEKLISDLISQLEVDLNEVHMKEITIEKERRELPNYAEYYVDSNVEHSLYEDFTHKRPYGFRINEQHVVTTSTWKEMLVKLCEFLIVIDESKFMSFEKNSKMNGKKRRYFSTNSEEMFEPWAVSGKIFVETNMSSNGFRNLMLKLLKEYNFKVTDFKVYLKADYSELNK